MIESILAFFDTIGLWGLYGAMLLEGSSAPFPGVAVVLVYGGILRMGLMQTVMTAAGMALVYALASLIPYWIGGKCHNLLPRNFRKRISGAVEIFTKYGIWSIAITRPFGIGNYISYLAGMSRVGKVKYMVLTFLGIFPWCIAMLSLGHYFNGNYAAFQDFYERYSWIIYVGATLSIVGFMIFSIIKRKKKIA